ncbi:MAG: UvrD-helicase domain-containing protein, partial [Planctomycetaceae bacterium]|nr:UvrD-helicase domain-containing protein [Planctomycetaceae bacterium]
MSEKVLPPDQDQRQKIVEQLDQTMLVEAAAGTGKTTGMLARMVGLIREGLCPVDTLAAVTFTRKAAAELRTRFQVQLERAAREATGVESERLLVAVAGVERCFIGTIHSFCARLLRERPIEAGVDLAFQELDDELDDQLRASAWSDFTNRLIVEDDARLDQLQELGLQLDQLQAGFFRFADFSDVQQWDAPEVELGDLTDAMRALEAYVIHMEALVPGFPADRGNDKVMNRYEQIVRLARNRDLQQSAQFMEILALFTAKPKWVLSAWPGGADQARVERDRWGSFYEELVQPLRNRWLARRYRLVIDLLQGAVREYDQARQASGRLNYQDLLMKASSLLQDKPQVRRYFRSRFTHLLVDEFQDTDPIQAEVMMFLTAGDVAEQDWRKCQPVPGSLFVVGDPKQSIYRFRRADILTYNQVKEIIAVS